MTEDLSSEMYPTMSRITPLIRGLQIQIKNRNWKTTKIKDFRNDIQASWIFATKAVSKATFLDPRLKKAAFGTSENADNAQQWVTEELSAFIGTASSSENVSVPMPTTTTATSRSSLSTQEKDNDELWNDFDQKVSAIRSTITSNTNVICTIKQYLEMPYFDRKKNPFEFWKMHSNTIPHLYKLACKYLNMPATSVPSERILIKLT